MMVSLAGGVGRLTVSDIRPGTSEGAPDAAGIVAGVEGVGLPGWAA